MIRVGAYQIARDRSNDLGFGIMWQQDANADAQLTACRVPR